MEFFRYLPNLEFKKASLRAVSKFNCVFVEHRPEGICFDTNDHSLIPGIKVSKFRQNEDGVAELERVHEYFHIFWLFLTSCPILAILCWELLKNKLEPADYQVANHCHRN